MTKTKTLMIIVQASRVSLLNRQVQMPGKLVKKHQKQHGPNLPKALALPVIKSSIISGVLLKQLKETLVL